MHTLLLESIKFATLAHNGQKRLYTGEPYVVHPLEVMQLVIESQFDHVIDPDVVIAAVLHDVLEDTSVKVQEIERKFGVRVAALVTELTNVYKKPSDGNREERKQKEHERLAGVSAEAQTIKVADTISNLRSLREADKYGFGKVYLPEKIDLADRLTKADPYLMRKLRDEIALW